VRWHDEEHGATPLHALVSSAAALSEDDSGALRQCLALLLRCGADVNAPAGNGSTPLHWAAGAGAEPAVRALIENGANPMARSYTWR
jgi:ankyrin repeat protein